MKRAAAIILSLMLMWLQVLASAPTLSATASEPSCGCCPAKKTCCCVKESTPDAMPFPVAPTSVNVSADFNAVLAQVIAWTLPETSLAIVSSSANPSMPLSAVPLFQRDCALLI